MVSSNVKTFVRYRIFQSIVVSRNLGAVSALVTLEKKEVFFDVSKKYIVIKSRGIFRTQ